MTGQTRISIVGYGEDDGETAAAWACSIVAINLETGFLDNAVLLTGAHTEHQATDKALNTALRRWRLSDGWSNHMAVVLHLESALATLESAPPQEH